MALSLIITSAFVFPFNKISFLKTRVTIFYYRRYHPYYRVYHLSWQKVQFQILKQENFILRKIKMRTWHWQSCWHESATSSAMSALFARFPSNLVRIILFLLDTFLENSKLFEIWFGNSLGVANNDKNLEGCRKLRIKAVCGNWSLFGPILCVSHLSITWLIQLNWLVSLSNENIFWKDLPVSYSYLHHLLIFYELNLSLDEL